MQANTDKITVAEKTRANLCARAVFGDDCEIQGYYTVEIVRDGVVIDRDVFANTVMTIGKNHLLDNYLAASAFTQTGPFLGMISSASYSAISAADTSASHAGWLEAGGVNAPTWSTPAAGARLTTSGGWSAASAGAKALSAALSFVMSGTGTLKGCAIWLGSGAVATNASTAGTLFSAGLFTGGDRAVISGDTVNVSYSLAV